MASETITRNDLTNILNEVLPPTASEYKKLLWTNPSPTSAMSGSTTVVDSGADEYDAIEVVYKTAHIYNGYETVLSPFIAGSHITLLAPAGTGGEFTGNIYNAVRTISMATGGVLSVDGAVGMASNGTSSNDNMCIPYKIYGIKYERVAPPLADIEVESLGTGAIMYRIGNIRILSLNGYAGENRTLHIDSQDAPSMSIIAPAIVRGSTGLSVRVGQINVSSASPYYVNRYYVGTYNNAGEGLSEVSSTDITSAVAVWSV